MPQDPIEFLALWLLRYCQNEQRREIEQAERDEIARKIAECQRKKKAEEDELRRIEEERLAREREEKEREEEDKQRQYELLVQQEEERQAALEEQLEREKEERAAKAAAVAEGQEGAEPPPPEDPLRKFKLRLEGRIRDLSVLDKSFIDEIHRYKVPPEVVYKVLKALFYILGKSKKELDEWSTLRQLVNSQLLSKIEAFDATKKYKPQRFRLCTRVLKDLTPETVSHGSRPAFLIYQWICATLELRVAAVAARKAEAEAAGQPVEPEELGVSAADMPGLNIPPEEPAQGEGGEGEGEANPEEASS